MSTVQSGLDFIGSHKHHNQILLEEERIYFFSCFTLREVRAEIQAGVEGGAMEEKCLLVYSGLMSATSLT